MAKTKQGKTTKGSRNSRPKYLGLKMYSGQKAITGNIIVRQRGTKVHPGAGVGLGKDHTIFALQEGIIRYQKKFGRTIVHIE